jgi:hypothetical protein
VSYQPGARGLGESSFRPYRAPIMKVNSVRTFVGLLIWSLSMTGIGMASIMKSIAISVPITVGYKEGVRDFVLPEVIDKDNRINDVYCSTLTYGSTLPMDVVHNK